MKKRIVCALFTTVLALSFAGCGNTVSAMNENDLEENTEEVAEMIEDDTSFDGILVNGESDLMTARAGNDVEVKKETGEEIPDDKAAGSDKPVDTTSSTVSSTSTLTTEPAPATTSTPKPTTMSTPKPTTAPVSAPTTTSTPEPTTAPIQQAAADTSAKTEAQRYAEELRLAAEKEAAEKAALIQAGKEAEERYQAEQKAAAEQAAKEAEAKRLAEEQAAREEAERLAAEQAAADAEPKAIGIAVCSCGFKMEIYTGSEEELDVFYDHADSWDLNNPLEDEFCHWSIHLYH